MFCDALKAIYFQKISMCDTNFVVPVAHNEQNFMYLIALS